MPASQEQKVDFLLKKIGYSASKTGIAEDSSLTGSTKKAPFAEAIPSPLIVPKSSVWSDSGFIPTTPPTSNTTYVGIYTAANAYRMTFDNTVGAARRTFIARSTYGDQTASIDGDWIDTQFGAEYIVKVYKGDPNSGGVSLQQAGGNAGTDGWFFDYSSGVLNFDGNNLPSGIGTDNVYILGYRYTGAKGIQPPAGIGTFRDLVVSNNFKVGGISTFSGLIDANGIIEGIAGQNKIPSLYANYTDLPNAGTYHGMFAHVHGTQKGYFAHAGGWYELVNKETTGTVGTGTERYNIGALDATSLKVTGITTLGSIGISTGRITGPSVTYIDPATVGAAGTVVILGNLQVDGTQTTVNSSVMTVTDKNIEVAKGAANDAAADGAGITVDAGSNADKTWQWLDATDSWTSSEHIRIPDGKVFGFASDTNTYIGRPAADTIAFTHGGGEKLRITSGGSVGIGTDSPNGSSLGTNTGLVHLKDMGSGNTALKVQHGSVHAYFAADNNDLTIATRSNHFMQFQTNSLERLRILSNGNIGIGTDTAPHKLSVKGTISKISGTSGVQIVNISNDGSQNGTIVINNSGGAPKVQLHSADVSYFNGGNVGIGSAIPAAKLDVVGYAHLDGLVVAGVSTFADDITVQKNMHFGDSPTGTENLLSFGAGNDLSIFHSGNGSFIRDSGTGSLTVLTNFFLVRNAGNNEELIEAGQNSSVNLFFDNIKRLSTTGIGASVLGQLEVNNGINVTSGVSTFTGAIDANGDLDVDGHTELDTVNVSGITTSALLDVGNLTNGRVTYVGSASGRLVDSNNLRFDGTNLFVSGINVTNPGSGVTSILGVDIVTRNLKATGVSTFVGNAQFDSAISVGSTTGIDGYYLKSTGIGVTWAAFPSSRTGLTTTATAGQTTFNFSYNIGFVDVFVNGVKLPASEFTASNGSTIVLDDAAFANDTIEFISLNTLPVTSSGGAQNLTGLADVTISGTPVAGETLQHNGSVFVNDYTVTSTKTSTSQASIHSLAVATYRSVEYTVQITEGTKYHVTKILAIHDGTNVTFNEYGTLTTHSSLATFALDVNSGNMRLLATPASSNSTVFKVKFNAIKV